MPRQTSNWHRFLSLTRSAFAAFGCGAALWCGATIASAATWTNANASKPPGASQNWNIGGNWDSGVPGPSGSALLFNGGATLVDTSVSVDSAQMRNTSHLRIGSGGTLTVLSGSNAFRMGTALGGVPTLEIASGGSLLVPNSLFGVGTTSASQVVQYGTVSARIFTLSNGSTYSMRSGTFTTSQGFDEFVLSGNSTFSQSGGTVNSNEVQLRANGVYEISGGSVHADSNTQGLYFRNATASAGGTLRVIGSGASSIVFDGYRYLTADDQNNARYEFVLDKSAGHITTVDINEASFERRGTLSVKLDGGVLLSNNNSYDLIEVPSFNTGVNFGTTPTGLWSTTIANNVSGTRDAVRVTLAGSSLGTIDYDQGTELTFAPAQYGYVDLTGVGDAQNLLVSFDLAAGNVSLLESALSAAGYSIATTRPGYDLSFWMNGELSGTEYFAWDFRNISGGLTLQGLQLLAVPEPATLGLTGLALLSFAAVALRRRRRDA